MAYLMASVHVGVMWCQDEHAALGNEMLIDDGPTIVATTKAVSPRHMAHGSDADDP